MEGLFLDEPEARDDVEEEVPAEPANPVTRPGDVWLIGKHRLACGDCRDLATVRRLLDDARANVCSTSPPYASQREYDSTSGFKPIPPDEYVAWYMSAVDPRMTIHHSVAPGRQGSFSGMFAWR